jgi:hypothetical protein
MGDKVATGIWYYDGQVPRPITIYRKEARLASSFADRGSLYPGLRIAFLTSPTLQQ